MDDSNTPPASGPERKRGRRRSSKSKRGTDWAKARRLYETEGKNFSQIAEIVDSDRNTVSRHARREGWLEFARVMQQSSEERREKLIAGFIEQQADSIREILHGKAALARRVLAFTERQMERLEAGREIAIEVGTRPNGAPIVVPEDPILAARRITLILQGIDAVDRSLADLKGHDWRSRAGGVGEVSEADAAAIRGVLDEAERAGADGAGPAGAAGPLPD